MKKLKTFMTLPSSLRQSSQLLSGGLSELEDGAEVERVEYSGIERSGGSRIVVVELANGFFGIQKIFDRFSGALFGRIPFPVYQELPLASLYLNINNLFHFIFLGPFHYLWRGRRFLLLSGVFGGMVEREQHLIEHRVYQVPTVW